MAEGGHDLNLSTERQQLVMGINLDDMASIASTVVQAVHHSPEDVETTLPTLNFSEDFISFCKDVEGWLIDLDKTYGIFSQVEVEQLDETGRQLREKQILISFVGHLNVGKSTLLNALLGAKLLPIRMAAETSIRVHIHHDAGDPKATSDQHPKLIVGKGKQVPPEEVVGVTGIYKKLETLNKGVREGAEGREKVCTIETNAPLLANAPPNWQVVLVDTPGTGEFNSRVAVAAEGAVKSSSAYVFVTTYGELESAENANFLRFLHEYDQGILEGRRLIVVVTQFDRTYGPNNTGGEITVEEVYEKVCQLVSEACPDVKISCDDVLPVSGLWAYNAQMLMSHPDGPEHDNYRRIVEWDLPQCQSLPCGQGQSWSSYFTDKSDDELAKQLLDVSGLASIEERIHNVTKSCIKVWVSKIKGDYERSLKQARKKLLRQSQSELKQQKKQEKEHSQIHECLGAIDEERDDLENIMKVKLYADLRRMYPQNLEVSKTLQEGRQMVLDGIKDFHKQCNKKVRDERGTFGQIEFDRDATAFLEKMSIQLEHISSCSGWFERLNNVLTVRTTEMGASIQRIKEKAQQLGAPPGQIPFQENAVEASEEGSPSEPRIAPKLVHRFTMETPNFPSDKVPWWTQLIDAFKRVISLVRTLTDPDQSSSCGFLNREQEATVGQFEEQLQKECDAYFNNIKSHTLKYFHDQYCLETKDRLKVLDGECKAIIDRGRRQLEMLKESLLNTKRKRNELQQLCEHLEKLATDLHTKADGYILSISD